MVGALVITLYWNTPAYADPTPTVTLDNFYRYKQLLGQFYAHGLQQIPSYLLGSQNYPDPNVVTYLPKAGASQEVVFADGIVIRRMMGGFKTNLLDTGSSYCKNYDSNTNSCADTTDNRKSLDFVTDTNLTIMRHLGVNNPSLFGDPDYTDTIHWHLDPYINNNYRLCDVVMHLGQIPWVLSATNSDGTLGFPWAYGNIAQPTNPNKWYGNTGAVAKFLSRLKTYYPSQTSDSTCKLSFSLISNIPADILTDEATYWDLYNNTFSTVRTSFPTADIAPGEFGKTGIYTIDKPASVSYPAGYPAFSPYTFDVARYLNDGSNTSCASPGMCATAANVPNYMTRQLYSNQDWDNVGNSVKSQMPQSDLFSYHNSMDRLILSNTTVYHEIHQFGFGSAYPTNQVRNAAWTFQVLMGLKAGYYYCGTGSKKKLIFSPPDSQFRRVYGWDTLTGPKNGQTADLLLGNGFVYMLLDRYRYRGDAITAINTLPTLSTDPTVCQTTPVTDPSLNIGAVAFSKSGGGLDGIMVSTFGSGIPPQDPTTSPPGLVGMDPYQTVPNVTFTVPASIAQGINKTWRMIAYRPDSYAFQQIKNNLANSDESVQAKVNGSTITIPAGQNYLLSQYAATTCKFCDTYPMSMLDTNKAGASEYMSKKIATYENYMVDQLTFKPLSPDITVAPSADGSGSLTVTVNNMATDEVLVLEPMQ